MQYVWLILFTIISSTVFLGHILIGDFLLPLSNVLPCIYWDLHAIMKYIGMEYQATHACPNDDILH